jgi:hypothetical protein
MANGLPINTANNLGKLRGSAEWKGHEQFITANHFPNNFVFRSRPFAPDNPLRGATVKHQHVPTMSA